MPSNLRSLGFLVSAILTAIMYNSAIAMEFKYVDSGGNAVGSEWISAEGEITNSTPDEFDQFLEREKIKGYRFSVRFDSPGGSLYGGLQLGRKIREYNLPTEVGRSVVALQYDQHKIYSREAGKCMSACAFAFLGGVTRNAESQELGIHQFYQEYAISNPDSKVYDSRDLQSQQSITGQLVAYTSSMGVDPTFISKSSSTPPSSMYFLSQQDLIDMRIIIDEDQFDPWAIKANNTRIFLESKSQNKQKEAYIFCGADKLVRLSVFNQHLLSQNFSFENYKGYVNDITGIRVFWTPLPKRSIRAVISNGIAGLELTLPANFLQMIRPTKEFGGMTAAYNAAHAIWETFQYDLSYENLQNGLAAIYRSCGP